MVVFRALAHTCSGWRGTPPTRRASDRHAPPRERMDTAWKRIIAVVGLLLALPWTTSPAAADTVDGTGAVVNGSVEETPYSWRAFMGVEGSFVLSGQTYGFFGQLEAHNNCCSSLGSSGTGTWQFSGTLISPTGALDGFVGSAGAWSGSMSYTRSEIAPGTLYSLDMRLSGPASAYLPDGRTVGFDIAFDLGGELVDDTPLDGSCGWYPGCSYEGTYNQHDRPSVVAVSATGGATSSGVSVGWGDSSAYGGSVCVSATGDCYGASGGVGVCPFGRCE